MRPSLLRKKMVGKMLLPELQLFSAEFLVSDDPQQAITMLNMANDYFVNTGNVFLHERCKKALSQAKNHFYSKFPKMAENSVWRFDFESQRHWFNLAQKA